MKSILAFAFILFMVSAQVVIYWGYGPDSEKTSLLDLCKSGVPDVVALSFGTKDRSVPPWVRRKCKKKSYTFQCKGLSRQIKACRKLGVKVLMVISAERDVFLIGPDEPASLERYSQRILESYGRVRTGALRPFMDADIDGFIYKALRKGEDRFLNLPDRLRELDPKMIIAADATCGAPLSTTGTIVWENKFDYMFVLFEGTPCSVREQFPWDYWETIVMHGNLIGLKIFAKLPASGNYGDRNYASASIVKRNLGNVEFPLSFAGFAVYDENNTGDVLNHARALQQAPRPLFENLEQIRYEKNQILLLTSDFALQSGGYKAPPFFPDTVVSPEIEVGVEIFADPRLLKDNGTFLNQPDMRNKPDIAPSIDRMLVPATPAPVSPKELAVLSVFGQQMNNLNTRGIEPSGGEPMPSLAQPSQDFDPLSDDPEDFGGFLKLEHFWPHEHEAPELAHEAPESASDLGGEGIVAMDKHKKSVEADIIPDVVVAMDKHKKSVEGDIIPDVIVNGSQAANSLDLGSVGSGRGLASLLKYQKAKELRKAQEAVNQDEDGFRDIEEIWLSVLEEDQAKSSSFSTPDSWHRQLKSASESASNSFFASRTSFSSTFSSGSISSSGVTSSSGFTSSLTFASSSDSTSLVDLVSSFNSVSSSISTPSFNPVPSYTSASFSASAWSSSSSSSSTFLQTSKGDYSLASLEHPQPASSPSSSVPEAFHERPDLLPPSHPNNTSSHSLGSLQLSSLSLSAFMSMANISSTLSTAIAHLTTGESAIIATPTSCLEDTCIPTITASVCDNSNVGKKCTSNLQNDIHLKDVAILKIVDPQGYNRPKDDTNGNSSLFGRTATASLVCSDEDDSSTPDPKLCFADEENNFKYLSIPHVMQLNGRQSKPVPSGHADLSSSLGETSNSPHKNSVLEVHDVFFDSKHANDPLDGQLSEVPKQLAAKARDLLRASSSLYAPDEELPFPLQKDDDGQAWAEVPTQPSHSRYISSYSSLKIAPVVRNLAREELNAVPGFSNGQNLYVMVFGAFCILSQLVVAWLV